MQEDGSVLSRWRCLAVDLHDRILLPPVVSEAKGPRQDAQALLCLVRSLAFHPCHHQYHGIRMVGGA